VILHREFLSCAVTQSALDALWGRFGLRQGSLTYPIHMPQVQHLLLQRYAQLADLQFSCWRAPPGQRACNDCVKCFQAALVALAGGVSPTVIGVDPVAVLCSYGDRRLDSPAPDTRPRLHGSRAARDHVIRCLQELPTGSVASIIAADPLTRENRRAGEALAVYARMRANALSEALAPPPGYIGGLLEFVVPELRGRLAEIFDEYFEAGDEREFEAIVRRARYLAAWITAPLRGAAQPGAGPPAAPRGLS
jgi:hypothetical protein